MGLVADGMGVLDDHRPYGLLQLYAMSGKVSYALIEFDTAQNEQCQMSRDTVEAHN